MPIAHSNKDARGAAQRHFKRARLRFGVGKKRRAVAHAGIDVQCHGPAAARDEPRQDGAQRIGQRDDRRIGKQVDEERLDRGQVVGSAEIEQHDRGAAHDPSAQHFDEIGDMFHRRLGQDAVAEIEDEGAVP